jgi:hypothetical protein
MKLPRDLSNWHRLEGIKALEANWELGPIRFEQPLDTGAEKGINYMESLNQQPGYPELTPDQPDDAADRGHSSEEPGWQSLRPDLLDRIHDPEAP